MSNLKVLVAVVAAGAAATNVTTTNAAAKQCGDGGVESDGCCACKKGWAMDVTSDTTLCSKCTLGYHMAEGDCVRTDEYDLEQECVDSQCHHGKCTVAGGRKLYPCRCEAFYSEESNCELTFEQTKAATYYDACPAMHMRVPEDAKHDEPFAMVITGCRMKEERMVAILPAGIDCSSVNSSQQFVDCQTRDASYKCAKTGIIVRSTGSSDSQLVLSGLRFSNTFTDTTGHFRVCIHNTIENTWQEVSSWNSSGVISSVFEVGGGSGTMETTATPLGELSCCEGLEIGSNGCFPVWAFFLLWAVMIFALVAICLTIHRTHKEGDMEKNNKMYTNEDACDKEMASWAKLRDDGKGDYDDDDF